MNATITLPNGKIKQIKNLGWLVRHRHDVERFNFYTTSFPMRHGILVAEMKTTGIKFKIEFADHSVCFQFLNRPSWKGLHLNLIWGVQEKQFQIGDANYKMAATRLAEEIFPKN